MEVVMLTTSPTASSTTSRRESIKNLRSGWNLSGRGYPGFGQLTMEITERDAIPKWDFQEPGARLRPWLRELNFWRHDTSTPLQKHGNKLYKSLTIGTAGR